MNQAVTTTIGGIKCDNKECDFVDNSVKVEDYVNWVNKPCPKCGKNLLTEEDFNNVQMLINMTEMINNMFPNGMPDDEEMVNIRVQMDGTGSMDAEIIED